MEPFLGGWEARSSFSETDGHTSLPVETRRWDVDGGVQIRHRSLVLEFEPEGTFVCSWEETTTVIHSDGSEHIEHVVHGASVGSGVWWPSDMGDAVLGTDDDPDAMACTLDGDQLSCVEASGVRYRLVHR